MKTFLIAAAVLSLGINVALAQGAPGGPSFKPQQYGTTAWSNGHALSDNNVSGRVRADAAAAKPAQDISTGRATKG